MSNSDALENREVEKIEQRIESFSNEIFSTIVHIVDDLCRTEVEEEAFLWLGGERRSLCFDEVVAIDPALALRAYREKATSFLESEGSVFVLASSVMLLIGDRIFDRRFKEGESPKIEKMRWDALEAFIARIDKNELLSALPFGKGKMFCG